MAETKFMFVIERYKCSELEYWCGHGNNFDTWTSKFNEACKFYDAYSAAVILAWPLGGIGRVAQHGLMAKEKGDEIDLALMGVTNEH